MNEIDDQTMDSVVSVRDYVVAVLLSSINCQRFMDTEVREQVNYLQKVSG